MFAASGTLFALIGIRDQRTHPASQRSGGQMTWLGLGRAPRSAAMSLCLAEPISGVNPTLAHEIFARILKLRDELGISFFIVEHRLDIALRYVHDIFAMALGRIIASGSPDEEMNNPEVIEAYLGSCGPPSQQCILTL